MISLSILIPVYNYPVDVLVRELHRQATALNIQFEIIVVDDCSSVDFENQTIQNLPSVSYSKLPQNIGRTSVRNLLAAKAKHQYLLFIDCDAAIPLQSYLAEYVQALQEKTTVICGGTMYDSHKPEKCKRLRWNYGKKYEQRPAKQRQECEYRSFSLFNTVISKQIFESIKLNESLKQYGHEDTLFGLQLQKNGISVSHIDNPLIHCGIDTNEVFLSKTKQSIENSVVLKQTYPDIDIRLLNVVQKLQRFHVDSLLLGLHKIFKKPLENCVIRTSSLNLYNLFKICYLIKIS